MKDNRKEEKKRKTLTCRYNWKNDKFVVKIYLNISWEQFRLAVAVRETGVEFEGEKKKWLDVRGRARAQALHSRDREEGVDIQGPRTRERKKEVEWRLEKEKRVEERGLVEPVQSSRTQAPRWKWKPSSQGLTSLLCERAFRPCECGQISPSLYHIVHPHSPLFNHPPSPLLTCTDIQQIFHKVKLEPGFDIQNPTIRFFSPLFPPSPSLVEYNNRFNFSTFVYSRPLPPLFFFPLFRCRHKILEASNWIPLHFFVGTLATWRSYCIHHGIL